MWTPFPTDGEWTRDASWEEFLVAAVNRREAELGLEDLRKALPPVRVQAFEAPLHPLAWSYIFRASRFSLVELGTAVRRFGPSQIAQRLRNSTDFEGTAAELRVGLDLQALGATVAHEPLGRGKAGPDWLTTWCDSSNILVEVKCPLPSRRSELAARAGAELLSAFMEELGRVPHVHPDTGTWLEFRPSREALLQVSGGGTINMSIVAQLGAGIAQHLAAFAWPLPDGIYDVGALGSVSLQRGAGAEAIFHFCGASAKLDHDYEFKRLYDDLQDAARQLAEHPSCPGLIVIDAARDRCVLNFLLDTAETLATEDWASRLVGVLYLARDFPDHLPDCSAHYVPGPLTGALNIALQRRTRCRHGGWHIHSGVFPAPQCPGWGHAASRFFDDAGESSESAAR